MDNNITIHAYRIISEIFIVILLHYVFFRFGIYLTQHRGRPVGLSMATFPFNNKTPTVTTTSTKFATKLHKMPVKRK